jgi:hypothetical protein
MGVNLPCLFNEFCSMYHSERWVASAFFFVRWTRMMPKMSANFTKKFMESTAWLIP